MNERSKKHQTSKCSSKNKVELDAYSIDNLDFIIKVNLLHKLSKVRTIFHEIISFSKYLVEYTTRTTDEEIAFTACPKIHSHSQIFRYGQSIFCLPHRPNFSDIFDLCLHWVSVVRSPWYTIFIYIFMLTL